MRVGSKIEAILIPVLLLSFEIMPPPTIRDRGVMLFVRPSVRQHLFCLTRSVASLGLVSPGAEKTDDLFCSILLFVSLGCHPPRGCHPATFSPVRPILSTILCKFSHNFFPSGDTPWRVSLGAVRSPRPLVTPLESLYLC